MERVEEPDCGSAAGDFRRLRRAILHFERRDGAGHCRAGDAKAPGTRYTGVAASILLPQAIVATISPWIGRKAETVGRKPLLLVGWGMLPLQGLAYPALPGPYALVVCYSLNAVSGAIFGVMMAVVAADLTRRTGGFNLALGALGVAISAGASASTFFAGIAAAAFGAEGTALALAAVGLCGWLLVWVGMPETRT